MMRHTENLDIVRTVYSGIQACSETFRNIQPYSGIIKIYSDIQKSV